MGMRNRTDEGKRIGRRVARFRDERRWDQSELARRAGVLPSYVNRLESGFYGRPSAERLTQLARALGVRLTDLTEPKPEPAEVPSGLEAELRALFNRPEDADLVAEILRKWARHDEATQRYLLSTMKPLVFGIPDPES